VHRRDEVPDRPRFADDRGELRSRGRQHALHVVGEGSRLSGLHDEHPLKNAAIDHGHAKERPIGILSGLTEVLESGMLCRVLDEYRPQLLGDQTGQPFADAHLHQADALRPEPDRGRQHQRRAIGLQQVHGTDVGIEPPLDQIHDVGQRFGWIAAA
jgi:hypothetical protein